MSTSTEADLFGLVPLFLAQVRGVGEVILLWMA